MPQIAAFTIYVIPIEYLSKQLHDYASGLRQNAIMQPFANALTEDDIQSVTAYYQSLEPMASAITPQAPE
ncbi:MAG: hypothetical protein V7760_13080 [Marinobacter sp.]